MDFVVEIPRFHNANDYEKYDEELDLHDESDSNDDVGLTRKRTSRRFLKRSFSIDGRNVDSDESDGSTSSRLSSRKRRLLRHTSSTGGRTIRNKPARLSTTVNYIELSEDDGPPKRPMRATCSTAMPSRRKLGREREARAELDNLNDDSSSQSSDGYYVLRSDIVPRNKRHRSSTNRVRFETPTRKSERSTRHQRTMEEGVGDYAYQEVTDRKPATPKHIGVKEAFLSLPRNHPFVARHCQQCETCGNFGSGPHGQLVPCQGCTLSYHKGCLGTRSTRDHLVTKVAGGSFVLQCRRCISFARRKESTAPNQGMCQLCRKTGRACQPFRERKTPLQEERERQENDGEDPVCVVLPHLLNNPENVLFRCMSCWRAFHFQHLLPMSGIPDVRGDEGIIADERHQEYARKWRCRECTNAPAKVAGLIAWKPIDPDTYIVGATVEEVDEDDKAYLIKWDSLSYLHAQWMPGAWTWGMTAPGTRKSFAKKFDGNNVPVMRADDAIPEDFMRIDIVLDVRFTSIVETRSEEIDKARIREVDKALLKYKGLGYEDVVWDRVPKPEDGDRWVDFVSAYENWVRGRHIHVPKPAPLKSRLEKVRLVDFNKLEKKQQPEGLVGGELMRYQIKGVNWLYYHWYLKKNVILADEMGLGKTIQIIGFLSILVNDHNCFPFLIVVPNSTCANWRREIKRWAPSLRVVTYFGSATARNVTYQHELYPEGSKDLRCHVVVTSYDAAADESCRRFFRSVPWQALIVDEGQRLKSDKNQIYEALSALKIPFRILLTGTPLQNNARELFNLLQFLDNSIDAAALELEYATLTKENVPELHNLIRPFFLRRTKAQVLDFLPTMVQVILPISMTLIQRRLYQSILTKNSEFIRALYDTTRPMGKADRSSLSNILMQLRKCLCHPFVYSADIEECNVNNAASHRNLVDASAKLQLLEILLPKLQQRGHRVLLFSQFLGMLDIVEDFLEGLGLSYQRLDGTISSLEKQRRIDEYNAKDSPLFAFLLSTRAGGVGINLAAADTVIILDPDFNPHQDIQALSRAHRIGQSRKVLCFQLMTRSSAEEKIVQIARKKMALDHILIEKMEDEDTKIDMESILKHGAADILSDTVQDIRYDDASVGKLLDRSQVEETKTGEDTTADSQFSFARVWANDAASMIDSINSSDNEERAPDQSVWDRILNERDQAAAAEAAARQQALGRGKRTRHVGMHNMLLLAFADRERLSITMGSTQSVTTQFCPTATLTSKLETATSTRVILGTCSLLSTISRILRR